MMLVPTFERQDRAGSGRRAAPSGNPRDCRSKVGNCTGGNQRQRASPTYRGARHIGHSGGTTTRHRDLTGDLEAEAVVVADVVGIAGLQIGRRPSASQRSSRDRINVAETTARITGSLPIMARYQCGSSG